MTRESLEQGAVGSRSRFSDLAVADGVRGGAQKHGGIGPDVDRLPPRLGKARPLWVFVDPRVARVQLVRRSGVFGVLVRLFERFSLPRLWDSGEHVYFVGDSAYRLRPAVVVLAWAGSCWVLVGKSYFALWLSQIGARVRLRPLFIVSPRRRNLVIRYVCAAVGGAVPLLYLLGKDFVLLQLIGAGDVHYHGPGIRGAQFCLLHLSFAARHPPRGSHWSGLNN